MQAFVTYDLNIGHKEVKDRMRVKGYYSAWVTESVTYYLPSTCLWKQDAELTTAKKDLIESINELNQSVPFLNNNIKLLRCIVLSATPWDGIPGVA